MGSYSIATPRSPARVVGVVAFVAISVLTISGPILTVLGGGTLWPNGVASIGIYPFAVVGVLIAWQRPDNAIAWVCLTVGLLFALEGALWGVALYGVAHPDVVRQPAIYAVVGDAFVMPGLFLVATVLLVLFPDGRVPSPRWRWLVWVSAVLVTVAFVSGLFQPVTGSWARPRIDNPMAMPAVEALDTAVFGLFGCVAAAIVAMMRRFRRARGIERLQLRWLVAAGAAAMTTWMVAIFAVADLAGAERAAVALTIGGFALIPAAIGVAVLRYRLLEIDRLISRTLGYAVLVVLLAGVYVAGVLMLGGLFPAQSEFAVAASTLAVAAAFNPLRHRVHRRVERRFNRSRYDARRALDRFASTLRDEIDLDDLVADVEAVVTDTVQPATVGLWMSTAGEPRPPDLRALGPRTGPERPVDSSLQDVEHPRQP